MTCAQPHMFDPQAFAPQIMAGRINHKPRNLSGRRSALNVSAIYRPTLRRHLSVVGAELAHPAPVFGASKEGEVLRRLSTSGLRLAALGAIFVLFGCTKQDEESLRVALADWFKLGETQYFYATRKCSAGLFELKSTRVSSLVKRARSLPTGIRQIEQGEPVVFKLEGQTPTQVTELIMSSSLHRGIGVISSGLGARACMTDPLQIAYYQALLDVEAQLVLDTEDRAILVVDQTHKRLFYLRGKS